MKGVILAGGKGTRLLPLTNVVNKHLLPVYNKTMIEYPIETLKKLGIREILIVTSGDSVGKFADYFGSGKKFGIDITYKVQDSADGIAGALKVAKEFANNERIAVILGDNVFDNRDINCDDIGALNACIFIKAVKDGSRFGVVEFEQENKKNKVKYIHEKPKNPPTDMAVTGLYIYPPDVFNIVDTIIPSERGELEITDVNNYYVKESRMDFKFLSGYWGDVGTVDSLLETSVYIKDKLK